MTDTGSAEEVAGASVAPQKGVLKGLLKTLRPHQWIKNLFVLAPVFFSKSFTDPASLGLAGVAFLLFSLSAGTVYLINDIFDIEKDREHPTKRFRPIPSGQLPIKVAWMAALALAIATQAVGWLINPYLGAVCLGYLVMNLAYSVKLKHVAFLDVTIIATGFVLRVLAGAFAIDVWISAWLIACTFLLALYLGMGKRVHELKLMKRGESKKSRPVLERYKQEHLDFGVLFVSGLTISTYTIYTLTSALPDQPLRSQHTPFASPYLPATIPFAVFGITRFYQLMNSDSLDSPTEQILTDVPFIANLLCWGIAMVGIAFFG